MFISLFSFLVQQILVTFYMSPIAMGVWDTQIARGTQRKLRGKKNKSAVTAWRATCNDRTSPWAYERTEEGPHPRRHGARRGF